MVDIDWTSLALPFAYVLVMVGSLYTFSTVYRKRKASQSANLEPWFPAHLQRNIYLSLLHLEPDASQEKSPKVPESVIRAALLRRAVEDIQRIIQVRTSKQALNILIQRGSVGDDLNLRFTRAEKEIEEELKDVVAEANALAPGWGQTIFQSANEINANTVLRRRLEEIEAKTDAEVEWWEKRRAAIQQDFMKELDNEATGGGGGSVAGSVMGGSVKAPSVAGSVKAPSSVAGSVKNGSDEDGVLVDSSTTSVPTTPGSAKKKKGGKK